MADKLPAAYMISGEIASILERIDNDEVELDEVEGLLDTLDQQLTVKGGDIARAILMFKDTSKSLRLREESIANYRKTLESRVSWLEGYLLRNMTDARITEIRDTRYGTEIAIVQNPPRVVIFDESLLPDDVLEEVITQKILKKEIMARLKDDLPVGGARLERGTRVRIK